MTSEISQQQQDGTDDVQKEVAEESNAVEARCRFCNSPLLVSRNTCQLPAAINALFSHGKTPPVRMFCAFTDPCADPLYFGAEQLMALVKPALQRRPMYQRRLE